MRWDGECGLDKPRMWRIFSVPPWDVTGCNRMVFAAVYRTKADTFHEAHVHMLETVERLGRELRFSFWEEAWRALDPSREAHEARWKASEG
jgi:hypothetical protein